jgi:LacI family transcriptional regulator
MAGLSLKRVALAFPVRVAHLHTVVNGIMQYAQQHGGWIFTTGGEAQDLSVRSLKKWKGDGVICGLPSEEDARAARRLGVPVVNFAGLLEKPSVPTVMMDQDAIGRLAADHLMMRGFRSFGFYGIHHTAYSQARRLSFKSTLESRGYSVDAYLSPNMLERKRPWDDEIEKLTRWLKTLPTPIGIFAVTDARARMLADACQLSKRKIPRDVGILGVDNSPLDCEFGSPRLSSIECDWASLGFHAAQLLDRLMSGSPEPEKVALIAPSGVIPRESTDITIVDHPAVAKAVEFLKANLGQSFGVKAMVAAAGVSRRYLESAFAESLHRSPGDYIAEMRVDRAKQLLQSETITLTRVARECGFSDLRQFRRVFIKIAEMSPRQYQLKHQSRAQALAKG